MNPTKIKPNTVFICGMFSKPGDMPAAIKEFALKEEVLNSLGFITFNPLSTYQEMDIEGFSVQNFFRCHVSCLAMCEKIVTLPNWDYCENSKRFVDIARIMNIEIIPYSKIILNNIDND